MEIAHATLHDLDALTLLFDAYRQFYNQSSNLEEARSFLATRITHRESEIFICKIEGQVVGFVQLYPSFSSVALRRLWILNDLYVQPDYRQRGVGEALLNRAKEFALETRAKGLQLETAADNLAAQRLYERLGWVRETEFFTYHLAVKQEWEF